MIGRNNMNKLNIVLFGVIFQLIVTFNSVAGDENIVTKQEAVDACDRAGERLPRHSEIIANQHEAEYLTKIKHGESAWVGDFAVFSSFIAWQGCYSLNDKLTATVHTLETNSLFECISQCGAKSSRHGHADFVGVYFTLCYCINGTEIDALTTMRGLDCDENCPFSKIETCGGHHAISIYRVYHEIPLRWAPDEPSLKQCVYVKKKFKTYEAYTASCYRGEPKVNAYFCTNNTLLRHQNRCASNTTYNCERDRVSSRHEAFTECLNYQGKLAGLYSGIHALTENRTYWLGEYRTFKISELNKGENSACLAVTNVNDQLYLDSDTCSTKKKYICKQSVHIHDSYSLFRIILICAIVFVVCIAVIMFYFAYYRKRKTHVSNEVTFSDVYEEIIDQGDQRYATLETIPPDDVPSCQQHCIQHNYYIHPRNSLTSQSNSQEILTGSAEDLYEQPSCAQDCSSSQAKGTKSNSFHTHSSQAKGTKSSSLLASSQVKGTQSTSFHESSQVKGTKSTSFHESTQVKGTKSTSFHTCVWNELDLVPLACEDDRCELFEEGCSKCYQDILQDNCQVHSNSCTEECYSYGSVSNVDRCYSDENLYLRPITCSNGGYLRPV